MPTPESPREIPFLERDHVKYFIQFRQIRQEDFLLLEKLAQLPRDLIIGNMHNFFSGYAARFSSVDRANEAAKKELQKTLGSTEDRTFEKESERDRTEREQCKTLLHGVLHFVERYDWCVAMHLVQVLEGEARRGR